MSSLMVFCNCASLKEAKRISNKLIKTNLVACINILPKIESIYRWNGKIVDDQETMMIIKTIEKNFSKVEKLIKNNHSYETPEIIAVKIEKGSKEYLSWVCKSCD